MAQNITKIDQVPLQNVTKINGITIDADDTAAAGEILNINGVSAYAQTIPTGLIIPYTAGGGGAPAGWSIYNTADGKHIIGAGSTYAVDDNGAGSGNIAAAIVADASHTGSTSFIVTNAGGGQHTIQSTGTHSHTVTFTYTPPYQQCYLIKADAGQTEFPTDAVVWTYGDDKSGVGNVANIWTDGYMFQAGAGNGTGGSATEAATASDSQGSHRHGTVGDGNDSSGGCPGNFYAGAHTHTPSMTMTNNLYQRALAAWSDAVAAVSFADYGSNIIGLYENTTPPSGWYLCDGNNGTPDMRDYFVKNTTQVGAGSGSGDGSVNVASAALSHGTHDHRIGSEAGGACNKTAYHTAYAHPAHDAMDHDEAGWLPAYYALAFIMKA